MVTRRGTRARSGPHGGRTHGRTGNASISVGRNLVPDPGASAGRNLGDVRHPGHPGIGDPAVASAADPRNAARCGAAPLLHCGAWGYAVSYTHLRAHETDSYLVCRLLLE